MDLSRIKYPGLEEVVLPKMVRIRQDIPAPSLDDVRCKTARELRQKGLGERINEDDRVAIAVGSRGIDGLQQVIRSLVTEVKDMGGRPFILPAMGSHGGGSARGQQELLESYGLSEEVVGAPINSSLEVVFLGRTENGYPLYFDALAIKADALIVVNRVKVHTDFSGVVESGLLKMLAIGLGNCKGANKLHAYGFDSFSQLIPEVGESILKQAPVVMGLALVENGFHQICRVEAVLPQYFLEREQYLLKLQKQLMPSLPFSALDILFVEEMGKDISGSGIDPNIVGRAKKIDIQIEIIIVSRLTAASKGNASGMGMVDIITRDFFESIDFSVTYTNVLTSGLLWDSRMPMVVKDDEQALRIALNFLNIKGLGVRMARIKNTSELSELDISEALLPAAKSNDGVLIDSQPFPLNFDDRGRLLDCRKK